jgi:hypothetical protein
VTELVITVDGDIVTVTEPSAPQIIEIVSPGDLSSDTTASVNSEVMLFSGTSGKLAKRASGTGLAVLTAGVLSVVAQTTDSITEGAANLYHTVGRVLGMPLTGLSTAAGTVVTAAHTILQAIGFLQKQASDAATAIATKAPLAHDHTTADGTGPVTNDEHDGYIEIATSATPATPAAGKLRMYSQDASGVGRLRVKHSTGSDLALFRDSVQRAKNLNGTSVARGEMVYLFPSAGLGGLPGVKKARADAAATMPAWGMVREAAADNASTTVQMLGIIDQVDTSMWAETDKLYISPTTAGALTNVEPQHPYLSQQVGAVLVSHATQGQIDLTVTPGHEGDDFGSNRSAFKIGPATGAEAIALGFCNAYDAVLSWTPTAARAIALPDASGTLALTESPTFTGTPAAPTAAAATNTTQLATTAHVFAERSNAATLTNKTLTDPTVSALNGGQLAGHRRLNINGACQIAQAGTSLAAAPSGSYLLDGFKLENGNDAVITLSQAADGPNGGEFSYSHRVTVTAADAAIAAGQFCLVGVPIEGFDARSLVGRDFVVGFWVRSAKTGVHCVAFRNSGFDRAYVREYTVNAADTWEKKYVTLPGGLITAGTWNFTSGAGLHLNFLLATGSTYQTSANAWQAGNFLATANQVNCLDTIGNIFAITGVQVEPGLVATPFEHRTYVSELIHAQRYYRRNRKVPAVCLATDTMAYTEAWDTPMRVIPTATLLTTTAYGEQPLFQTARTGASSAINNVHMLLECADISVTGFSGLTVGAMAMFDAGQVAYSARL